jgi:putative ABC transport system substrate-binding protein
MLLLKPRAGMRRREFIAGFGTLILGASAQAQEPIRRYRLALLLPTEVNSPAMIAFFEELRLNGFIEGQNLEVIPDGLDVQRDQLAAKIEMIMKAAPDLIVSGPDVYTLMVQKATRTIPIVAMSEDMVLDGLVPSLSRPGGNTTGISIMSPGLDGKRQDLLIEAVPGIRQIATFRDSTRTGQSHVQNIIDAAARRGVEARIYNVAAGDAVLPALDAAKASGASAVNFLATPLFTIHAQPILDRVAALRLPAMHQWPETAEAGGMIGYGPRFTGVFRQRARVVARVLHGAKPADIPSSNRRRSNS